MTNEVTRSHRLRTSEVSHDRSPSFNRQSDQDWRPEEPREEGPLPLRVLRRRRTSETCNSKSMIFSIATPEIRIHAKSFAISQKSVSNRNQDRMSLF